MRIESVTTSSIKPELTPELREQEKLKKACKDFEAVLTGFMLKAMRSSVQKSDFFGSEKREGMFTDMMDQQLCSSAAESSSNGIAEMLYKELSRKPEVTIK
jgi:peptidoglycan hydrolase FlgJ